MKSSARTTNRILAVAAFLCGFAPGLVGLAPGGASARAAMLEGPLLRVTNTMELRGAVRHGEYDEIRRLSRRHDDAASLLGRAYLAELDGTFDRALRFVGAAADQATDDGERRAIRVARARLLRAKGAWDDAEAELREVLAELGPAPHARVELGALLIDSGRLAEAKPLLEELSRDFNAGRLDSASGLYALGRGMALLGGFKDANHAFQLAYEKNSQFLPGIVDWGELFLSKYSTADAKRTFQDALSVNERHPGALIGMARVVMETKNYYAPAREFLRRAEKHHPSHPQLQLARAELAIHDGDWEGALEYTSRVLETRPKHLEALAVEAAVHYLRHDREAFEATKQRALDLHPSYAELYTRTAEFAVLSHRYREAIDLHRKALELDDGDPRALLGLGMGLSRLGRLDRAVKVLKEAFDADPYNVRAYNMVQFFEETMPKYDVFRHDRFLLRAHQSGSKVIDRLVAPLVSDAIETYTDKYDFEPADELSVEIYRKPQSFGVRTVGLPNISPHGICFGRVVATRTPREGNFNWKQVVWHEMAHVYHIQESGYGVPRWFTEGLAEYETNVENPSWVRHHERRIAAALREDSIPSITELDQRFTQARSYEDILKAYHLSSLVLHFIVETWSFDRVEKMVEAFGDELRTAGVIEETLGVSVQKFDAEFRAWLENRLHGFDRQLLISLKDVEPPAKLEAETPSSRRDGWYHARLAVGRMYRGKTDEAVEAMNRALELGASDPRVQYAATAFFATRGRSRKAYEHGLKVLEAGRDDYVLRVRLGRLARILEKIEAARVHLIAAVQLYPDGFGAWRELLKIAESTDDEQLKRRSLRRMFQLDQTSALAARRYAKLHADAGRWGRARKGVERWYAIEPFNPELHRLRAEVARHVGAPKMAMDAWVFVARLRPNSRKDVWLDAVENLSQIDGADDQLRRAIQRAREAGASGSAVDGARVN